jgi:hypothetical protein
MKKNLLLLLIAGFWGTLQAQNVPVQSSRVYKVKRFLPAWYFAKAENSSKVSLTPNNNTNKRSPVKHIKRFDNLTSATKVYIGSAQNLFGVITPECTQVSANQDLNMVGVTHRESAGLNFGDGAYETDYSLNGGTTWDTATAVVFKLAAGSNTSGTRYPNGVILNPVGNTSGPQAYAITNGPHTNGTSWDSVAYGSIQFDSLYTNMQETLMYPNVTTAALDVFSPPHFMSVSNDSVVHSVEEAYTLNATTSDYQAFYGAVVNKGVWNGATHLVTWTSSVIRPAFVSTDGITAPVDSDAELSGVGMAWSQDGSVGYVVFFGDLDSAGYNFCSYQPIVYKSTDHGTTWLMMPLFNFSTIPNLVQFLRPTIDSANVRLPFWDINGDSAYYDGHDYDMTVDMNYNLHIFGAIEAGAIANPDSSGYTYNPAVSGGRYIYDVYTTSDGGWKADFLDSLISPLGIDAAASSWSSTADGAIVWGARIQATRTTDGSKVFCTWTDDFNSDEIILLPDIATIGIDIATNLKTPPTRVTTDGDNFFLMVSDIALPTGDSCWSIPCAVVADPAAPDEGLTPIEFWDVQGATLCNSDFNTTSIPQIVNTNAGFSITQNYPNPFNNVTKFNVNLVKESSVSVDVYNMFGQKIYSIASQNMEPGSHSVSINGAGWDVGVYFYKVTVNNQSITKKMVVQ